MGGFDPITDLFRPALLLIVGALAYFVRATFSDLKDAIAKITARQDQDRAIMVTCDECEERTKACQEYRKDRNQTCQEQIRDLRLVTSDLMACVNKYVDSCDVKQR